MPHADGPTLGNQPVDAQPALGRQRHNRNLVQADWLRLADRIGWCVDDECVGHVINEAIERSAKHQPYAHVAGRQVPAHQIPIVGIPVLQCGEEGAGDLVADRRFGGMEVWRILSADVQLDEQAVVEGVGRQVDGMVGG